MVKNSPWVLLAARALTFCRVNGHSEEEHAMATAQPDKTQTAETRQGKWWCNFCELRTDDQEYYLSHSCQEELKKRGVAAPQEKSDHCR
jgi:hypothetical protein